MSTRQIAILLLAASTAACANDHRPSLGRSVSSIAALSKASFGGASGLGATDLAASAAETPARTLSSRILAAIALEAVTGRRPDPGRLAGRD